MQHCTVYLHAQHHYDDDSPALRLCIFALQYGNGTLRLTTRQAYQLHGVLKTDLKTVFSTVIKNMGAWPKNRAF